MGGSDRFDVAVVGGGPAGLATAVFAARSGLATVVLEEKTSPPDKACGEGLMPAGVRVLDELGVTAHIASGNTHPLVAVRYILPDGTSAKGRLATPGGLGIRRTALAEALARCAADNGVTVRWGCRADGFAEGADRVAITTAMGEISAHVLVAADGLHSRIRSQAGLDRPTSLPPRFGLRQHFRLPPWSDCVEVYAADEDVQAYVTPAGVERVGVAFLWDRDTTAGPVSVDAFLARFPTLAARLAGAPPDSRPRGAGPLAQATRARTADRLALVGDAAGYVDAITGEGLSLALTCARVLGAILPTAIEQGATRAALAPYERFFTREFRRYAFVCRAVLAIARRPGLRDRVLHFLGRHPRLFDNIMTFALD